jgi:hypothetical protein
VIGEILVTHSLLAVRWVEKPDLSRVDEIGCADLMPGSGHSWGGFVNVGRIDVYGTPIKR